MRLLSYIITFILINISFSLLNAEEKKDYRNIILIGIDKAVNNSVVNTPSPLFFYSYTRDDFQNDLYLQFVLGTTNAYFVVGLKNDNSFTGIKPVLNHTVYSANHYYVEGVNDGSRCYKGSNSGVEFFFEYPVFKYLICGVNYYPGYYWYADKKKSDNLIFEQNATEIDLPQNHWEHIGKFEITISDIKKKDIDRVKHGFILKGTYSYTYRRGYGTFYDNIETANSSIDKTQKRYLTAGLYYNFENDINLKFDISGVYNSCTDRNNAEQIGSYVADSWIMPGYYRGEFYHNKFSIASTQVGVPLFFWNARLQPGFNILYMPEDNDVTGVDNYPLTLYRSFSLGLSFKAGGVLPLFFNYAYGFDARRLNTGNGVEKKGNHELLFYLLAAI